MHIRTLFPQIRPGPLSPVARWRKSSRRFLLLTLLGAAAAVAPAAYAGLIASVTEGPANAPYSYNLTIEFGNSDYYNFVLRSSQASYTGLDFINTVALLSSGPTTITLSQVNSAYGYYLNAITIGGDTNSGFVNNSYWAYWNGIATNPVQWTYASVGEGDRTITPGQADGWVYSDGSHQPQAVAFVPEPATWMLLGLGAALLAAGRRARAGRGAAHRLPISA